MTRSHGRSARGERVCIPTYGQNFGGYNIMAGLLKGKLIGLVEYVWNTNSEWFNYWFECILCPLLKRGSVIILDNARFHRPKDVHRIANYYGLKVLFLPPYSPDFNPMEHKWANKKNWLRIHSQDYKYTQLAIEAFFKRQ